MRQNYNPTTFLNLVIVIIFSSAINSLFVSSQFERQFYTFIKIIARFTQCCQFARREQEHQQWRGWERSRVAININNWWCIKSRGALKQGGNGEKKITEKLKVQAKTVSTYIIHKKKFKFKASLYSAENRLNNSADNRLSTLFITFIVSIRDNILWIFYHKCYLYFVFLCE